MAGRLWTTEEEITLKTNYAHMPVEELQNHLSERTVKSIVVHAVKLGLKKNTYKEAVKCRFCGEIVKAKSQKQLTCLSPECKRELKLLKGARYRKKHPYQRVKVKISCKICGVEIDRQYSSQNTCLSMECKKKARQLSIPTHRIKRPYIPKPKRIISCDICGKEIEAKHNGQKICLSVECKNEARRLRLWNWKSANREKVKQYARERTKKPEYKEYRQKYVKTEKYKTLQSKYHKDKRIMLRREVVDKLGHRCACCGESRYEFLAIDHIYGGGNQHRKTIKGERVYAWLIKNNFPEGFQLLCHNCNMAKGFYGICPHAALK